MEIFELEAIETLPQRAKYVLFKLLESFSAQQRRIYELRLQMGCGSSVWIGAGRYRLCCRISEGEICDTLNRLCQGALYAHADTIAKGYISYGDGVRVGVCGYARYDGGALVGIDEISMLVYRFPGGESSLTDALCAAFSFAERGMLIYSVAGGGKTTALRSLCKRLASTDRRLRIAVVDERCEFFREDCDNLGIALLRGYRRSLGVEIALRALSANLLVIDEIGVEDESYAVRQSLLTGARLLATAHAGTLDDVLQRDAVRPYLEKNIFDVFFGIFNTDGNYYCEVKRQSVKNGRIMYTDIYNLQSSGGCL